MNLTIFEIIFHKQPEVIRDLVMQDLLPVSVLSEKKMPEERSGFCEILKNGRENSFRFFENLMKSDHYKRIGGYIKQRGWGK